MAGELSLEIHVNHEITQYSISTWTVIQKVHVQLFLFFSVLKHNADWYSCQDVGKRFANQIAKR